MELDYHPDVRALMQALCGNNFVHGFDWGAWQPEGETLFRDPELLQNADQGTCCKLITLQASPKGVG